MDVSKLTDIINKIFFWFVTQCNSIHEQSFIICNKHDYVNTELNIFVLYLKYRLMYGSHRNVLFNSVLSEHQRACGFNGVLTVRPEDVKLLKLSCCLEGSRSRPAICSLWKQNHCFIIDHRVTEQLSFPFAS